MDLTKKLAISFILLCNIGLFGQPNIEKSDSLVKVAQTQLSEQKYKECIEVCSKGIEVNPNEYWFYVMRGSSYEEIKDNKAALIDYSKAIEINPNKGVALYNRGLLYRKMGKKIEGKKDVQKAADLNYYQAKNYLKSNPNAFK